MSGPLAGYRVVELAGIGPAPFAAMMLSDMGAEVLRVDRIPEAARAGAEGRSAPPDDETRRPPLDPLLRGRRSVGVDLRHRGGPEVVLRLAERADALIEGFRPGVAERLGIGPEPALDRNPRLVYGRMTGWGQEGPLAGAAGHDIN
ncbi:MAG: CoA transferase, partial [Acidimicrobiales bacterium]|nr:CoA transferase [Acidimicrobiales bacterium]